MFTKEKKQKSATAPLSQEEWNIRFDILMHSLWIFVKCLLCLDTLWYFILARGGYAPPLQIFGEMIIVPAILTFAAVIFEACCEHFRYRLPLNDYTVLLIFDAAVILVMEADQWTHSLQVICILPMIFGLIIGSTKLIYFQSVVSAAVILYQFVSIELDSDPLWKNHILLNVSGLLFDIILIARLIIQIRKYTQMLDTQTTIDSLTRLHNHEAFYEELDAKLAEFKENEKPLSVLIADIDNFKKVNDTYGHAYGDKVLKVLAGIFSRESSERCFAARYGGEEFAMIMELNQSDAITKAQTIRKSFEQQKIRTDAGEVNSFTVSVGVAFYDAQYATSSQFFEKADEALYKAKAGGKNRVCV